MHCSSLFAPFLACVVPSFYSIFYCILCPVPACGCASERWHRSRCPQLNFPATYLCLLCLPAALFSFLPQKKKKKKKKKTRGRVTAPPIALPTTSSLFYLTPLVPCSSYYFAAPCSSCLVILINTVPGNSSSDSSPQGALHSCLSTHHTYTSGTVGISLPFPTSLPSSQHQSRCVLSPSHPFLCMPPHACIVKSLESFT